MRGLEPRIHLLREKSWKTMVCRVKCSDRRHSRHLFGDMTDTFSARQVDGGDLVSGEENSVFVIVRRRPDGEPLAAKGLRDFPGLALEAYVGLGRRYDAHNLMAVVFGFRQALGHRALARPVAAGRHLLAERFMRPLEIVDFAPGIEGALRLGEIAEVAQCEHLGVERAMEAFVLAAALRMVGAAVNDRDAELEKPYLKPGPALARRVSPRGAVVDEERLRQAIMAEGPLQP